MLFCADGFIHVTLCKMPSTNLMLEMIETSKNFKVDVRHHVIPALGTVIISGLYTAEVSI